MEGGWIAEKFHGINVGKLVLEIAGEIARYVVPTQVHKWLQVLWGFIDGNDLKTSININKNRVLIVCFTVSTNTKEEGTTNR